MPEWESFIIAPAALRFEGQAQPRPVVLKAGVVRVEGQTQIALQADDRPLLILSPSSATKVIGALWEGIQPPT